MGFLSHWAHFTVDSFVFMCLHFYILCFFHTVCHIIVTLWDGPGGTEA